MRRAGNVSRGDSATEPAAGGGRTPPDAASRSRATTTWVSGCAPRQRARPRQRVRVGAGPRQRTVPVAPRCAPPFAAVACPLLFVTGGGEEYLWAIHVQDQMRPHRLRSSLSSRREREGNHGRAVSRRLAGCARLGLGGGADRLCARRGLCFVLLLPPAASIRTRSPREDLREISGNTISNLLNNSITCH